MTNRQPISKEQARALDHLVTQINAAFNGYVSAVARKSDTIAAIDTFTDRIDHARMVIAKMAETDEEREDAQIRDEQESNYFNGLGIR